MAKYSTAGGIEKLSGFAAQERGVLHPSLIANLDRLSPSAYDSLPGLVDRSIHEATLLKIYPIFGHDESAYPQMSS